MATNNNNNNNNTYNGVPVPQLDFGETVSEPVAPQPPKKSKAPLFIAIVLVLLAAAAFAMTAFVWPGFLVEDKPAVTDADTDVDEEGGAQTTAPTTTTTTTTQPTEKSLQLEDAAGNWNVTVNVETVCNQMSTVSSGEQAVLYKYCANLFKGYTVSLSGKLAADGTFTASLSKAKADTVIKDVYTRAVQLINDREKFYIAAKMIFGVSTNAEVDAALKKSMLSYDTLKMMVSTGVAEKMVTELISTYANEMKVFDAATNSYVFPPKGAQPIKLTLVDGKLGVAGSAATVDVTMENNKLVFAFPEDESALPPSYQLLKGVTATKVN